MSNEWVVRATGQPTFFETVAKSPSLTEGTMTEVSAHNTQTMKAAEARANWNAGAFAFFEAVGARGALDILTGGRLAKWTALGDPGDATSLAHMLEALDYIDHCNHLRVTYHGLHALGVSDAAMAAAAHNCNWAGPNGNHPNKLGHGWPVEVAHGGVAENLAWGTSSPGEVFQGWYWQEKHNHEVRNGEQTGHYLKIISPDFWVTGFAVSNNAVAKGGVLQVGGNYGTVHEQYFMSHAPDQVYSVAEYRARLMAYIRGLDAVLDSSDADSGAGKASHEMPGNGCSES